MGICWRPPIGYALDAAIGTTFTLDLMTLLTVPLAFTMFDWTDEDGRPRTDPLALLESVRRTAGRMTIFGQAGRIAVPPKLTVGILPLHDGASHRVPRCACVSTQSSDAVEQVNAEARQSKGCDPFCRDRSGS